MWWLWILGSVVALWWILIWLLLIGSLYESKGYQELLTPPAEDIGFFVIFYLPAVLFIGINGPVFFLVATLAPSRRIDLHTYNGIKGVTKE